jgi:hypothetical protein
MKNDFSRREIVAYVCRHIEAYGYLGKYGWVEATTLERIGPYQKGNMGIMIKKTKPRFNEIN